MLGLPRLLHNNHYVLIFMVLLYGAFDTLSQLVLGTGGRQSQCSCQCAQVPRGQPSRVQWVARVGVSRMRSYRKGSLGKDHMLCLSNAGFSGSDWIALRRSASISSHSTFVSDFIVCTNDWTLRCRHHVRLVSHFLCHAGLALCLMQQGPSLGSKSP